MSLIKLIENPERGEWDEWLARPAMTAANLEEPVRKLLQSVRLGGDAAVRACTREYDKVLLEDFSVSKEDWESAAGRLDENLKQAIRQAREHIEKFHRGQISEEPGVETGPGIRCWRKAVAIDPVGLYIPGGTAPLFSTLLMLGIPARLAGCTEIVVCTPPLADGSVHPAILFCASELGISHVFRIGGAQAIAAMAYGTETVPKVNKIFGPGNQYVTEAKKIVQQEGTAIDMPAGPSELAIFADDTADPACIAADLLSQCEHGSDSQVILVTESRALAGSVARSLAIQWPTLPRKDVAGKSLANSRIFLVNGIPEAMDLLNAYAPEHLILNCAQAGRLTGLVKNAGSVFLGNFSPESAGDYASGTNHTLPTNGFARSYSGVSVDSFVKKISFQELTPNGLRLIQETIVNMARAEGLEAHARAVDIRFKKS